MESKDQGEFKKLVLVRLQAMPSDISVHMGSVGELTREDLLEHVKKGDDLGRKIIAVQLRYIRAMKDL
jgi:hypothetical protein